MNSQELKAYFKAHPMSVDNPAVQPIYGKLDVFARPDQDLLKNLLQGSASDFFYQDHQVWLNQLVQASKQKTLPAYESLMQHLECLTEQEFREILRSMGMHFMSKEIYEVGLSTTGDPSLIEESYKASQDWANQILAVKVENDVPNSIPIEDEAEEEDSLTQEAAKIIFEKIIEQVGNVQLKATGLEQIGAMWKFGLNPECTIAEALKAILE